MKKTFKIILFSSFVGLSLATLFFFNIKEKASAKNIPILYAFQTGVFKTLENANNFVARFEGAKVVKDKEYYRVFIGITKNNKDLMEQIFKDLDYTYYIKEIETTEEVMAEIEKYDELLKSSDPDTQMQIIAKMLESYVSELQN